MIIFVMSITVNTLKIHNMTKELKTKFWEFGQNNSGGYFIEDDENGVCETIIIEARTSDDAWIRLTEIGSSVEGFWDFCGCCGERWSNWIDESDGKEVPMHYDTPIELAENSMFRHKSFVHYLDGSIKEFKFN